MHIPSKVFLALHRFKSGCVYFSPIRTALIVLAVALLARDARAENRPFVPLRLPVMAASLTPIGPLAPTKPLQLTIALPLRNQPALNELLQQLQDPASPRYHRYLTPAEFTRRFGPTEADYRAVTAFAQASGLRVTGTHANRLLLDVSGPVATIERAFHVSLRTYQHPAESRTFYAPDSAPSLDLSVPILQISGLDNYSLPRPRLVAEPLVNAPSAQSNLGSGPHGTYMGRDFRAAYAPDTTLTGSGQTVGLLQFDGYTPADITYYESKNQLPNVPLHNVLIDGASGLPSGSGGEVEVSLDIEMAISMAPNLAGVIVYEAPQGGSWLDLLNRMATDDLARQLSCSWYIPGGVADPAADQIFQQMDAQGQTFLCASGDEDAYTGLIPFPNDSPYITQVGGTTLATAHAAGAYASETVWNYGGGTGSGGGISTQYPIPSWQTNISMTANQGSTTMHNIPDVALTADNVYVRVDGVDFYAAGTSCASPLWAGFTALINQQAASTGQAAVGFLNPALDAIGTSATYPACFHDTTQGNNESPSSGGRFVAVSGYDLCTGWGTPAGQNLINALANPEPLVITPLTGFAASGAVGGPFTVTAQTFTLTNIGTNTLTWTLSSTSVWLRVSSPGGILSAHGPAATLTVSLTGTASNLAVGTYSATLWFTNASDHVGQARTCGLSVIQPPLITTEPTNVTALEGQPAAFSATASGGQPLTYQWRQNGTNIVDGAGIFGSATSNLVFTTVTPGEAGAYTLLVTNAAGVAVSTSARLTVPASPPVFTLQPTNETIYATESAEFAAAVVGTTPYSYQWDFNASPIPGATNATLTLTDLQTSQSGNYTVVVTNPRGSTTSAVAVLTVSPPPPCAPISAGMLDWWPGEGNAGDSVGTNNGTLVNGVTFATGEVGTAFNFNGSDYVSIPDSSEMDSLANSMTVEAWIKVTAFSSQDWISIVCKGDTSWQLRRYRTGSTLSFWTDGLSNPELAGSRNVNDGLWHHIAGVYDGMTKYLYVDGTLDASEPATGSIGINSEPLLLGDNPTATQRNFDGLVDEVSLYSRALSADEIQTIYVAGIGGKCPVPIVITTEPTNETVSAGSAATWAVSVTGSQPFYYQWNFDGTNIPGATNSVLTIEDVQPGNSGIYTVTVANRFLSVTSSNAILTVLATPPFIITEPVGLTNYAGTTATFGVVAGGSIPLSYQWIFNGTNLSSQTNALLSLTNVQESQAGGYSVLVSNSFGATNSYAAVLSIVPPPNCAPVANGMLDWWSGEGNAGDSIGTNNGSLQNGVSFAPGEVGQAFLFNGADYVSIPDSPALDALTNSMSVEAWVKVTAFSGQDWIAMVCKGDSSWQLRRYGSGSTLSFWTDGLTVPELAGSRNVNDGQWHHMAGVYDGTTKYLYVDGTLDVSEPATGSIGVNSDPLLLGSNPEASQRTFNGLLDEVSVYNRALSPQEIQTIYLAGSGGKCPVPVTIAVQPTNEIVIAGATATLSVVASGSQPLAYQWSFGGTNIAGATNGTFTVAKAEVANAGVYSVMVSNPYGEVTSSNALLNILAPPPPVVVTQPVSQSVFAGVTVNFTVTAGGVPPLKYQWNFNSTNIPGATNATLTLTNVQPGQSGNYAVNVSNSYGSTNSANAVLMVYVVSSCDPAPPGILAWWPGEGNACDTVGTNMGTLVNGVAFATGEDGQAFSFNGTDYVSIPNSPALDSLTNSMTVEAWIKVTAFSAQDWIAMVCKGDTSWQLRRYGSGSTLSFWTAGLSTPELAGNRKVNDGQWHHVAGVYDGSTKYLYVDGTIDVSEPTTGTIAVNSQPLFFGSNPEANQRTFDGLVDEVSVYGSALSAAQIAAIYNAGAGGKCPVSSVPPFITSEPTNQTVPVDSTVSFSVVASGSAPLNFAWSFDGISLPGATNATLTLTNVQLGQAGNYIVSVTNSYGATNSATAMLTVLSSCDPAPLGLIDWWPGEGTANDAVGTNNGTLNGGVTFGPGEVGQAFSFNGSNYVSISNSPALDALSNSITVEAWINVTTFSSQDWISIICKGDTSWELRRYGTGSTLSFWTQGLNNPELEGSRNVNDGKWHHVAGVYNGTTKYLYVDGTLDASAPATGSIAVNSVPLWLGDNPEHSQRTFNGFVDEVSIYNRALSAAQIAAVYAAGSQGKCPPNAPYVFLQPANEIVALGGVASFSVAATGTAPLNFQWRFNGTNLVGTTNATLVLTNVQLNEAGSYAVLVTNSYGSILSSNALLSVAAPPVILQQPGAQTNVAGTTANFTISASGSLPMFFQWQKNGVNLLNSGNASGVTTTNLTLSNVSDADGAEYGVVITNIAGAITSSPAPLIVLDPPAILLQPTNQTVLLTSNASFGVVASGSNPLQYQWEFNGTNISGQTNAALTLTNVQFLQSGRYSVWVTNGYGSALSSNAVLLVNPLFHFVWNLIPSPRFVNTPFSVVVVAQNPTNGIATNFISTVAITTTNGIPTLPLVSGNFNQGVWTGSITVAELATNLVLKATDSFGESSLANPFNVVSLPTLSTVPSSGTFLMLWPVSPSGFLLEKTPQLISPTWVPVSTPPFQIGNQYLLPIATDETNAFYRLHFIGQ